MLLNNNIIFIKKIETFIISTQKFNTAKSNLYAKK